MSQHLLHAIQDHRDYQTSVSLGRNSMKEDSSISVAFLKDTPVILIPPPYIGTIGYSSNSILFHVKWFLGTQALLISDTYSY